jgi:hypothetical protein
VGVPPLKRTFTLRGVLATSARAAASEILVPASLASVNLTGIVAPAVKLDLRIGERKPPNLYLIR